MFSRDPSAGSVPNSKRYDDCVDEALKARSSALEESVKALLPAPALLASFAKSHTGSFPVLMNKLDTCIFQGGNQLFGRLWSATNCISSIVRLQPANGGL